MDHLTVFSFALKDEYMNRAILYWQTVTKWLLLKAFDDLVPQHVERNFFLDGDPF
jgi:hypothetical protein